MRAVMLQAMYLAERDAVNELAGKFMLGTKHPAVAALRAKFVKMRLFAANTFVILEA